MQLILGQVWILALSLSSVTHFRIDFFARFNYSNEIIWITGIDLVLLTGLCRLYDTIQCTKGQQILLLHLADFLFYSQYAIMN